MVSCPPLAASQADQTETWLTNVQDKRSHNWGVVAAVDGVSMVDERPRLPSPLPDGADGGNAGREGNPSGTYS